MRAFLLIALVVLAVHAKKQKEQKPKEPKVEQMPCPYMREQAMSQMDPMSRANAEYQICKQNCLMKHHQQQMQMTTEQKVEQLRKELADAENFLQQMNEAKGQDGHSQQDGTHQDGQQDQQAAHPAGVHQSSQMSAQHGRQQAAKPHTLKTTHEGGEPADYKV